MMKNFLIVLGLLVLFAITVSAATADCNVSAQTNGACDCASVFTNPDTSWQYYDNFCTDNGGAYTMAVRPSLDCDTFSVSGGGADCAWGVNNGDVCPSYERVEHAVTIVDCICQQGSSCAIRGNCASLTNAIDCDVISSSDCTWIDDDPDYCTGIGYADVDTSAFNLADPFFAGVPEFFGIHFEWIDLSSGLIAAILAIALPMTLYKRKKTTN